VLAREATSDADPARFFDDDKKIREIALELKSAQYGCSSCSVSWFRNASCRELSSGLTSGLAVGRDLDFVPAVIVGIAPDIVPPGAYLLVSDAGMAVGAVDIEIPQPKFEAL
jgi:hypothetical protein